MKDINEYYGSKIHGKKVAEGTDILDERKKHLKSAKKCRSAEISHHSEEK